jgi:hypothetical protein
MNYYNYYIGSILSQLYFGTSNLYRTSQLQHQADVVYGMIMVVVVVVVIRIEDDPLEKIDPLHNAFALDRMSISDESKGSNDSIRYLSGGERSI